MNRRLHVVLLLVSFGGIFWAELPDAIGPLVMVIPVMATPPYSAGFHAIHIASLLGIVGAGASVVAWIWPAERRWFAGRRVALVASAVVFVGVSRPFWIGAITAVPFCVLAFWPARSATGR